MKRYILLIPLLLMAGAILSAQEEKKKTIDLDKEFFHLPDSVTNEYLDNVDLNKRARINNYWMVGVYGGVSVEHGYYNPLRQVNFYLNKPVYGFSIVRHATMMNMFPNLGMELGYQHNYEGYQFKEYEVDGFKYQSNIDGAYEASIEVQEGYLLTHAHFDLGTHAKILAKAGLYGGYRTSIHRDGPFVKAEYLDSFQETDKRWTYGMKGGVGFGLMFDPFEIHLTAQVKWGWNPYYPPDKYNPYRYRYAYPLDGAITLGVYYQLSPRRGHTRAGLRKLARAVIEEEQRQEQKKP